MSAPRPVRIPRAARAGAEAAPPPPRRGEPAARPNRAATQRAVRLSGIYLLVLLALYLAFALVGRAAPGGSGSAGAEELLVFSVAAIVLGVAGVVLTLSPVPRSIVPWEDGFDVISRWGRRSEWRPLSEVTIHRVRRYPAGFLASAPVDSVELSRDGRRRKSYLIDAELLPDPKSAGGP